MGELDFVLQPCYEFEKRRKILNGLLKAYSHEELTHRPNKIIAVFQQSCSESGNGGCSKTIQLCEGCATCHCIDTGYPIG